MIGLVSLGVCNFLIGTVSLADAVKNDGFNLIRLGDLAVSAVNYVMAIMLMGIVLQKLNLI